MKRFSDFLPEGYLGKIVWSGTVKQLEDKARKGGFHVKWDKGYGLSKGNVQPDKKVSVQIDPESDRDPEVFSDSEDYTFLGRCYRDRDYNKPMFESVLNEGPFKTIADNVPMTTRLRRINTALSTLCTNYHVGVPLQDIFDILKKNGFDAVQEDGTPWDGIISGREARYDIELVDTPTGQPAKQMLHMTHHKMDVTGKYEVVAYVN